MSLVGDVAAICRDLDDSPVSSTADALAELFGREASEELMDHTKSLWPHDPRFAGAVLTGIVIGYRLKGDPDEGDA